MDKSKIGWLWLFNIVEVEVKTRAKDGIIHSDWERGKIPGIGGIKTRPPHKQVKKQKNEKEGPVFPTKTQM